MPTIRPENLSAYLDHHRGAAKRIAEACGVHKTLVSRWKKGLDTIPEHHNENICLVLGRSLADLCQPLMTLHLDLPDTPEMRLLFKLAPELSDLGLEKVLETALQQKQLDTELKRG